MSIACPTDLNTPVLRSEISSIYRRVARAPDGEFISSADPAMLPNSLVMMPRNSRPSLQTVRHPSPALATRWQSVQFTLAKP